MTAEQEELLRDVHSCLVGNKIKGQRGLIDRVDLCENLGSHHEDKINSIEQKLEKKADKVNWMKIFTFGIKTATKVGGM